MKLHLLVILISVFDRLTANLLVCGTLRLFTVMCIVQGDVIPCYPCHVWGFQSMVSMVFVGYHLIYSLIITVGSLNPRCDLGVTYKQTTSLLCALDIDSMYCSY